MTSIFIQEGIEDESKKQSMLFRSLVLQCDSFENLQGLLCPLSSFLGALPLKPMLGVGSVAATPCSKIRQVTPSEGVLN